MSIALAEKKDGCRERRVKIGVIQLAGSSLDAAERFLRRTAVIDPTGKYVLQLPPRKEGYASAAVDLGLIERVLIDRGPIPMRTQMLTDQGKRRLSGRRRPDAYGNYM
jgi:predicted amidohydrolase